MLILSRKVGESIVIDGRITVTVIQLPGGKVRLGIDAPRSMPVHRQEVQDQITARSKRLKLLGGLERRA